MAPGKRLIVAGAAALVIGLVVTFPARIAYQWLAPPGVTLSGISGSVWSGKAAQGSAAGLYLSDLSWRFRPLSLFALKASYHIEATPPAGFMETDLAVSPGGTLSFAGLNGAMPLAAISAIVPMNGIEGDVSVQLERLVIDDGFPVEVDGTIGVTNLVLRALSRSAVGDYRAVLETADDAIRGTVEDVSGVLDIDGTLVLGRDRGYSLVGTVAGGPNTPAAIMDQLRFLGSPDAEGKREFRFEGSL